jgi:hypothetical protein
LWTGRVLATLSVLFLLFDAAGKLLMPPFVVQACRQLGFPVNMGPTLGVLLTVSTLLSSRNRDLGRDLPARWQAAPGVSVEKQVNKRTNGRVNKQRV